MLDQRIAPSIWLSSADGSYRGLSVSTYRLLRNRPSLPEKGELLKKGCNILARSQDLSILPEGLPAPYLYGQKV